MAQSRLSSMMIMNTDLNPLRLLFLSLDSHVVSILLGVLC